MDDAEVITCDLTPTKDRHGNHACDDRCREVRRHVGALFVTDLLTCKNVEVEECNYAPLPLLRRKAEHFRRIEKTVRLWENREDGASHIMLDRLLNLLDDYTFCGPDQLTKLGPKEDPPADKIARRSFDVVAPLIMEHRLTSDRAGVGRRRYEIVRDICKELDRYRVDIAALT